MMDWRSLLAVVVGAGIGGLARYAVSVWFVERVGPGFPFGTLFINVSGSFLIGFITQLGQTTALGVTPLVRLLLATGFCGGYTTFSTFSYELVSLSAEGLSLPGFAYATGSVVVGMIAAYLGILLARVTTGTS
jgi:CrcB protein